MIIGLHTKAKSILNPRTKRQIRYLHKTKSISMLPAIFLVCASRHTSASRLCFECYTLFHHVLYDDDQLTDSSGAHIVLVQSATFSRRHPTTWCEGLPLGAARLSICVHTWLLYVLQRVTSNKRLSPIF